MITVVIPLFNRENLIAETLDSVRAQTWSDWECIVVDDGSTDRSVEVVSEYGQKDPRIRLIRRPDSRIKGAPTCRNIGLENAAGEFVHFLDSDDLLAPRLYQTLLEHLAGRDTVEYAVFPYDGFATTPSEPVYFSRTYDPADGSLFEQLISGKTGRQTSSILWRRSFLEKHRLFWREGLVAGQDTEFGARALCYASEGRWLDIPRMVHLRRSNMDSIMAGFKKSPEKKIRATTPLYVEAHELCKHLGKMTHPLHRRYLRSLVRAQLIFSLLHGDSRLSYCFYESVLKIRDGSWQDRVLGTISRLIVTLTPPLYVCGMICCRLPYWGPRFHLAKSR